MESGCLLDIIGLFKSRHGKNLYIVFILYTMNIKRQVRLKKATMIVD